ncbi:MAG: L-threonylcarbamoyladenylate synthase [Polyangiales bacterium]
MPPDLLVVDPLHPDPAVIAEAAARLVRGELVAFPTETVYGLGARADRAEAAAKIFAAKGRPAWTPLIVHVTDLPAAQGLVRDVPAAAAMLAARFWPGPLTLVLARDPAGVPDVVCAGGPTVALRSPAHPVARALLRAAGVPVAAPSANRFQTVSPVTAAHVLKSLGGRALTVLDGGRCGHGIESTVLDLTRDEPTVLRHGALSVDALRAALPGLRVEVGVREGDTASPGTAARHYAPGCPVLVVDGDALSDARASLVSAHGEPVMVLRIGAGPAEAGVRWLPADPAGYGAALYDALHAVEDAQATGLVVEAPPTSAGWEAVRDRLQRASTPARR